MDKTLAWSCLLVALVSLLLFTAAPWKGGSNEEDLECSELEEEDQDQGKTDQFQGGDQVREKQGGDQVREGQNCVRVRKEFFTNWAGNIRSEGKVCSCLLLILNINYKHRNTRSWNSHSRSPLCALFFLTYSNICRHACHCDSSVKQCQQFKCGGAISNLYL